VKGFCMYFPWSRLGVPLCFLNLHAPGKRRAMWDGKTFTGHCQYCKQEITRASPGVWRRSA